MMRAGVAIALAILHIAAYADDPAPDKGRVGWHFYDDPLPPPPPPPPPAPAKVVAPPPVAVPPARPPELKLFEDMQRKMEELRNVAIVNPSEDNVKRYMLYEQMVKEKAYRFAEVAQLVSWSNPSLDSTLQGRPVNPGAAKVYDDVQDANTGKRLADLGKDHALLFFFRSDCPYCHRFAPILAYFQKKYGIRVDAVSLDGGGLPEFPRPRVNNGIAERLGVQQVPAVFLAQPFRGEISTVGYGVMSTPELEQRVIKVADAPRNGAEGVDLTKTVLK